ncbi:MAG: hypothetical protein MJ141_08885 [Clostridia bacterium]|nr:hypothetical protein [Clostridia bacterium]
MKEKKLNEVELEKVVGGKMEVPEAPGFDKYFSVGMKVRDNRGIIGTIVNVDPMGCEVRPESWPPELAYFCEGRDEISYVYLDQLEIIG